MKLIVAGCGPAGLFAAICAARAAPGLEVTVLERDEAPLRWMSDAHKPHALTCAAPDPDLLARAYPRGSEFMHGAVQVWPGRGSG
ncbi:MAG: NAD(P)/FAD-dependent oxidoreductase [Opitutales bacterium]|jgi:flavin-dependent dehydrogenase